MRAKEIVSEDTIQVRDIKALLRDHPEVITHMHDPPEDLVLYALKQGYIESSDLLKMIKDPSQAILKAMINYDASAIASMKNPSEELQLIAIKKGPHFIEYIKKPTAAVQLAAFKLDPNSLSNLKKIDPSVIQAITAAGKGHLVPHAITVTDPTEQIDSLKANINNLNHFPDIGPKVLRFMLNTKRSYYLIDSLLKANPDALEKNKVNIIKVILKQIKSPDDQAEYPYHYPNRRKFLIDVLDVLKAQGRNWDDLEVIRKSLKVLKPKSLGETDE